MIYITDYIDNFSIEEEIFKSKIYSYKEKNFNHKSIIALLVWHQKIDSEFLDLFPNVKFIQRWSWF